MNSNEVLSEKETPGKVLTVFSMTESLACSLVARLVAEWDTQDKSYFASKKTVGGRGIPLLPGKRAQAYRVLSERTRGLVPPRQLVFETSHGKQNGLDKTAGFAVIHWYALAQTQRLDLLMTYACPGWRLPRRWGLFQMSTHALRRLFFRLRTMDQSAIFAELEPAVRTVCTWFPVLMCLIECASNAPNIGVPTPHGVLYLKRSDQISLNSPGDLIAATWISDTRMNDNPLKLSAVKLARLEGGVILQIGYDLLPMSLQRNLHLLTGRLRPFDNLFYQDMLRHLPPPACLVR